MMANITDVVQQMNERNTSRLQMILQKLAQQQAETAKLLQKLNSNKGGDKNKNNSESSNTQCSKQPIDPNKPKFKYCDKMHNKIDNKCWKCPENQEKTPQWYKKKRNNF